MKLEKVREILVLNLKEAGRKMPPDTATALSIAIEAVKREQLLRREVPYNRDGLLPGETED